MPVPIQGPIMYEDIGNGKRRRVETTLKTELHVPVALAYKVESVVEDFNLQIKWHFGESCVDEFIQTLFDLYKWAQPLLTCNTPMIKPDDETLAEMNACETCHICNGQMDHTDKHLDHDHISGRVSILRT